MSGAFNLTKNGSGKIVLTGANTRSGSKGNSFTAANFDLADPTL